LFSLLSKSLGLKRNSIFFHSDLRNVRSTRVCSPQILLSLVFVKHPAAQKSSGAPIPEAAAFFRADRLHEVKAVHPRFNTDPSPSNL